MYRNFNLYSPPVDGGGRVGVEKKGCSPSPNPIRVKLSVSWGSMDKLCLSMPRNQQRYESYRRCGRSLSPAGGGKGGGVAQVRILAYLQPEYLCVCFDTSKICNG